MSESIQAHPLYLAAVRADADFDRTLVMAYGKGRASEARYFLVQTVPACAEAKARKLEADAAWRLAIDGGK